VASSTKPNMRALVVLTALVVIVMTIAVPLRALVKERRDISMLKAQVIEKQKTIAQLQADAEQLKSRAYLQSLARSRLNYVFPGEIGLVVIDQGTSTAIETVPGALVPNDSSAWYSKLWRSTQLADKPRSQNDPLVINDKAESK
jgi:cell division protein FtsB